VYELMMQLISRAQVAICVTVAIFASGCDQPPRAASPIRPVRTVKVGDVTSIAGREFPGRASAKDEVELSFQVAGPLVSLPVDVGSTVKAGAVIAAIDPRDFETVLASNLANLDRAKANLLAMERGARPEEIERRVPTLTFRCPGPNVLPRKCKALKKL
jgi:multidrug efflux pump subunit AcrA (membrane-fusion protein)